MKIKSKTLNDEVDVTVYLVENERGQELPVVTSNSLLKVFNGLPGVTREFPVNVMGKEFCYSRCVIRYGNTVIDADGDANADYEEGINKNHLGMTATRRAFDRAFLDFLNLEISTDSRIYSNSEGITGKRRDYVPKAETGTKDSENGISLKEARAHKMRYPKFAGKTVGEVFLSNADSLRNMVRYGENPAFAEDLPYVKAFFAAKTP